MKEFVRLFENSRLASVAELISTGAIKLDQWAAGRGSSEQAIEKAGRDYGLPGDLKCSPKQFMLAGKHVFVKSYQTGKNFEIATKPQELVMNGRLTIIPSTREILVGTVQVGVKWDEKIYDAKKLGGFHPAEYVFVERGDFLT